MVDKKIIFPILELTDWVFDGEKVLEAESCWKGPWYIKEKDLEKHYQRHIIDCEGKVLKVTFGKLIRKEGSLLPFIFPPTLVVEFNLESTNRIMALSDAKRKILSRSSENFHITYNKFSFMHISLDGFVAGPNGEMNWIKVDEEIFDHVGKRISQTDAALYGRVTYEMMEGYWPGAGDKPGASKHDIEHSKWYGGAHKIVLSKTMKGTDLKNTTIISDNLPESINKIKEQGEGDILLFGSPTATHALIQEGLIDGYWLFVNPIVLGEGIPLFKDIKEKIKLNLLGTKQFSNGVTELGYTVENR